MDGELIRQQTREIEPEMEPDVTEIVEREGSIGKKKGRLRAVSETLGEMMSGVGRSKRRKNGDGDDDDGGGEGPSQ